MDASEEDLRLAVDEVLNPIWRREARRALGFRTVMAVVLLLTAVWVGGILVVVKEYSAFPWSLLTFPASLAGALALIELGYRRSRRRQDG